MMTLESWPQQKKHICKISQKPSKSDFPLSGYCCSMFMDLKEEKVALDYKLSLKKKFQKL